MEAESPFIEFEDLLTQIEDLVVDVSERVMKKAGDLVLQVNPVSECICLFVCFRILILCMFVIFTRTYRAFLGYFKLKI